MNKKFNDLVDILKEEKEIEFSNNDILRYEDLIFLELIKFLSNFLNYDFRTVPGVMNQVILYKDDNLEIRIHDFIEDCSDTYIHNHKNPFISYCLYGGYKENIYTIKDSVGNSIFEFDREKGGVIKFNKEIKNKELVLSQTRFQFERNILLTDSKIFHSIEKGDFQIPPLTFIIKYIRPKEDNVRGIIYNNGKEILNPITPIRKSYNFEVLSLKNRTEKFIQNLLNNY